MDDPQRNEIFLNIEKALNEGEFTNINCYIKQLILLPVIDSTSQNYLIEISKKVPPTEIFFEFLEHFEEIFSFVNFSILIEPLINCILRAKNLDIKYNYLNWFCNPLIRRLKNFQEDSEEILTVYDGLLKFLEKIIEDSEFTTCYSCKKLISEICLKLLGPLSFYTFDFENISENCSYADSLLRIIKNVKINVVCFLEWIVSLDEDKEDDLVTDEEWTELNKPIAIFYYLVFTRKRYNDIIPSVLSKNYLLNKLAKCSLIFLQFIFLRNQMNGLELLESAIEHIPNQSINFKNINGNVHSKLFESVYGIILYCEDKAVRQIAVKIFRDYIFCFNSAGRYAIILQYIQQRDNCAGFNGYLCTIIKDVIYQSFKGQSDDIIQFSGTKLVIILDILTDSQFLNDEESEYIYQQVISVLNLFRYLLLADKTNRCGIDSYVPKLKQYLVKVKKQLETLKLLSAGLSTNDMYEKSNETEYELSNNYMNNVLAKHQCMDLKDVSITCNNCEIGLIIIERLEEIMKDRYETISV